MWEMLRHALPQFLRAPKRAVQSVFLPFTLIVFECFELVPVGISRHVRR
jgi:hypothetical protein